MATVLLWSEAEIEVQVRGVVSSRQDLLQKNGTTNQGRLHMLESITDDSESMKHRLGR